MNAELRVEKFLKRVKVDANGCWLFQGMINPQGYGQVKRDGKFLFAHRYSWKLHRGEIGEGLFCLHKCDVRHCVNPDHLFIGTQKNNQQDMAKKKRHVFGERSSQSKLKEVQVQKIYDLYESGVGTIRLAAMFGVTKNLAWMIVRGKVWRHLYEARYGVRDAAQTT